ncbi:Peptidogalycan biosysnthesis/recognition [Rheinheimera pacifica]|uniref:Peptidogalycan biosysnthesis/recognition n=1 Tax=Rheinheimera pacifica TaxID=173990 RepID=A0A1H6LY68_9GAMM|nr:peptidogalycan biosysnthesis protein [Rheinheimera pacifica]SEH90047.1 Peptidogalycan biosysnthesis/recognition [Rheinheimera pacifica]
MQLKWLSSLAQVTAQQWDALFTNDKLHDTNLFCRHAFLLALEQGGSVDSVNSTGAKRHSGWYSQHLTLWQDNILLAAVPGYIKSHSYGEYLFDWQIAEAYQQHQLAYYPKWIAAIRGLAGIREISHIMMTKNMFFMKFIISPFTHFQTDAPSTVCFIWEQT